MTCPPASPRSRAQQGRHRGHGARQPGDHVGERQGRQHRLAVGKAGAVGKAAHRLDQRAETGLLGIGAGLAEAGNAHDDEARVARQQQIGGEAHGLERAGPVVLDEDVGRLHQPQQRLARRVAAQVQDHRHLVAAVRFPEQLFAAVAPSAQRIAFRRLDLDDLGAEIAELQRQHVAGDEAREIEHAHAAQGALRAGVEADDRPPGVLRLAHDRKFSRIEGPMGPLTAVRRASACSMPAAAMRAARSSS